MARKSKKTRSFLLPLLWVLLVVSSVLFLQIKSQIHSEVITRESSSSTILTSPSPSPKPLSIPVNYGRSVNVPILTYHYIGLNPNIEDLARDNLSVAPDKFEEQLSYLSQKGYNPISLDTLYAGLYGKSPLPTKPIILTFDDGYIDFYVNAFPLLHKFNFHTVSFIPTGLIGQGYYMSWSQIREIDSTGLVSFQAHSVQHPNLTILSDPDLRRELTESKKTLEANLGKPVNFFAYPYGASDSRVWAAAKNAGFLGAVGTWASTIESEGTIFDMPRLKISGSMDMKNFSVLLP